MGDRVRGAWVAAGVAAVAFALATAPAAAATRASGRFSYTSIRPGSVTGMVFDFHFHNRDDPSAKPPAVAQMVVRTPPGSRVDVNARPQCHASDIELRLEGPAACPSSAKVGTGLAIADSGRVGANHMMSTNDVVNFNGEDGVIGAAVDREYPFVKNVDHTRIAGNTSTTVFPVFPGLPPPDSYTALVSIHAQFPPLVGADRRPWARTPRTCPRAGYWTTTATFTYQDGAVESIQSHSRCKAKKPRKQPRKRRPSRR